MTAHDTFPHPEYKRYVLEPAFAESQRLLLPYMLTETGIMPWDQVAVLLKANRKVEEAGVTVGQWWAGRVHLQTFVPMVSKW